MKNAIVLGGDYWPGPVFLSCQGQTSRQKEADSTRGFALIRCNSVNSKQYATLQDSSELFGTAAAMSEREQRRRALATIRAPAGGSGVIQQTRAWRVVMKISSLVSFVRMRVRT